MKIRHTLPFVALWIGLGGCGTRSPRAAFEGDWTRVIRNGITNTSTAEFISVLTDGRRFSIIERSRDQEFHQTYDGSKVSSQYTYLSASTDTLSETDTDVSESTVPGYSPINSYAIDSDHMAALRFWARPVKGSPREGIRIAGRWTRLYEGRVQLPQGFLISQRWLDSATGIALQEIETLYSSPAQMLMTQTTYTCQQIAYGDKRVITQRLSSHFLNF